MSLTSLRSKKAASRRRITIHDTALQERSSRRSNTLQDAALQERASRRSNTLHAAALQDHFSRSLKLDLHMRRCNPSKLSLNKTSNNSDETAVDAWTCDNCTLFNRDGGRRCGACGSSKFVQQKESSKSTLAQKLGIVPGPPQCLSEAEWGELETRCARRKDSYEPCPICQQEFGTDMQLILSCSHVFHKECLEAFERFVRSKERSCPLCRRRNYQKRIISQGTEAYRDTNALRIQRCFRGYRERIRFHQNIKEHYKFGFGNPALRKVFFAKQLNAVTDRLVKTISAEEDSLEKLFRDIDNSLLLSHQVFGKKDCLTSDDWSAIFQKVKKRDDCECPICMCNISISDCTTVNLEPDREESNQRRVIILDCSHVFHDTCINSFERFNIDKADKCPMCRAMYREKMYVV